MKYQKNFDRLVKEISAKNIVSAFTRIGKVFYDEPSLYFFTATLSEKPSFYQDKGYILHNHLSSCGGAGLSFFSESLAAMKSLSEAVERFSGMVYQPQDIEFHRFQALRRRVLSPLEYGKSVNSREWGWVRGTDWSGGEKECLIPAQLVFLHNLRPGEPALTVRTSTGTASGFNRREVLLRGLYEVVERDAFMTAYYNRIPLRKICPDSIHNDAIQDMLHICDRYRLEVHIFDMTNDLGIPAFLTILTDKTGLGPSVSAGMKAGYNVYETVGGSIQEAFISRFKMRYEVYAKGIQSFAIKTEEIDDHIGRGLYWYPVSRLRELSWLLDNPCVRMDTSPRQLSTSRQIDLVMGRLKLLKYNVYYYDLTLPNFRDISFYTLKVIVPKLQPLHIAEGDKQFVRERMEAVARHFGRQPIKAAGLPHFF